MSATERRSLPRTAAMWDALAPVLDAATAPLDVVDLGGGTGGFAVPVAQRGHRVVVVDPSPDALAALGRRAQELDLEVVGRQGDLSDVVDLVGAGSADLVLCHGVLEVVPDATAALAALHALLRDGGALSLLVAQRHAAVLARARAGHLTQALALLDDTAPQGRTGRRFTAEEVQEAVRAAGLVPASVHGVRVFADQVPESLLDLESGAAATLTELERAVATRPEYWPLASQLHVLAHRPA
ncbi:class I SAM-dependent methyltransferase [Nocardioides sp.]|uniref:class I SAM-dependent methyltransferase n=1 Tax=Nocardioides sp. TaxID=35761 RepID=UPI0035167EF6